MHTRNTSTNQVVDIKPKNVATQKYTREIIINLPLFYLPQQDYMPIKKFLIAPTKLHVELENKWGYGFQK